MDKLYPAKKLLKENVVADEIKEETLMSNEFC